MTKSSNGRGVADRAVLLMIMAAMSVPPVEPPASEKTQRDTAPAGIMPPMTIASRLSTREELPWEHLHCRSSCR